MQGLEEIPCRKMIFLDACNSGNAGTNEPVLYGRRLEQIIVPNLQQSGMVILASSSANESSYEHYSIENGLFTEAIVEALSTHSNEVDHNNDQLITLGEFFDYVQQRVPVLTEKLFRDRKRQQRPILPIKELEDGFPLFFLGGEGYK